MNRGSLVSRLIWYLTAAMAVLWLLGSVTTGALTVFEINERLDNALEEVAQRLLPATFNALQEPASMQRMARRLVATMDPKALAYQIIDPAGRIAMRSDNAPATPFPVPRKSGFYDVPHYRVYNQVAAARGYFIEVAEPAMHRRQALRRAIALSVGPLLFFLPISWFLIRWTVFRSMASLTLLREEIGRRDGTNLAQIVDPGMPTELAPILSAVNRLLQRLEQALVAERQFAANSAHELRTPIAAVLAQMQLLAAQLAPATPQAQRAERIVGQIKGLGSLAERLLQFSRTGAGFAPRRERTDVITVLQVLIDEFSRLEDVGQRLKFVYRGSAQLLVWADLDVIGIALRNLIENAIRYGTPNEPIEIVVEGRSVRILNGGPALPPDKLAELKQPFVRGSSVPGGGGLGLAIVENVMRQLGGSLLLASPPKGRLGGFEATLAFPEFEASGPDQPAAGRSKGLHPSAGPWRRAQAMASR